MDLISALDKDTLLFFLFYCATVVLCWKDPVLRTVSVAFAGVHLVNLAYEPVSWVDLCIEAVVCSGLAYITFKSSKRAWSIALMFVLLTANVLILVEFIDYFCCNSYFNDEYGQWVDLQTVMELIILAMASHGLLQHYTNDRWAANDPDKHNTYR